MSMHNFEKFQRKQQNYRKRSACKVEHTDWYQVLVGFSCQHCGIEVSSEPGVSRVLNRNHCPICLWSKHVDLYQAGDRLNACKAGMRPVGVTFKQERNKYGSGLGELQLIHQCTGCGGISINRIAADDDAELIWDIYEDSLRVGLAGNENLLAQGIHPAGLEEKKWVYQRLFGMSA